MPPSLRPAAFLGHDAGDRLRRVVQLHVVEGDPVARLHLLADPGDIGVVAVVAAPGVPVDDLPFGLGEYLRPRPRFRRPGGKRECDQGSDDESEAHCELRDAGRAPHRYPASPFRQAADGHKVAKTGAKPDDSADQSIFR